MERDDNLFLESVGNFQEKVQQNFEQLASSRFRKKVEERTGVRYQQSKGCNGQERNVHHQTGSVLKLCQNFC